MTAAPAPTVDWIIRPAGPEDVRFIVETTAKVRQPRGVPWTQWEPVGARNATEALRSGNAAVADTGDVLLGFVLYERPEIEMLYVKREFRGLGIGKELLHAGGVLLGPMVARNPTPCWRRWCAHHGLAWRAA